MSGKAPNAGGSLWALPAVQRLAGLTLLGFSSFFLTLASLPAWAVDGGAGRTAAGFVTTAMLGATVATQFAVPAVERRLGQGRTLLAGVLLLGAPAPLYLLSQEMPWLVAVSVVRGAGFGVITVLGAGMAARITSPERRGESLGIYGLAISLPSLAAVPLGAALVLSGNFAWAAGLAALPIVAVPLVAGLSDSAGESPHAPAAGRMRARKVTYAPALVLLISTAAGGGLVTLLPIERPDATVVTGALFALGVATAFSRWAAGIVADRHGTRVVGAAALMCGTAGMALVAWAVEQGTGVAGAALLCTGTGVFGLGFGAVQILTLYTALRAAEADQTTTVSSLWNASFDIGTGFGAIAVGAVASAGLGLAGAFGLCAAAVALSSALTGEHAQKIRASPSTANISPNE